LPRGPESLTIGAIQRGSSGWTFYPAIRTVLHRLSRRHVYAKGLVQCHSQFEASLDHSYWPGSHLVDKYFSWRQVVQTIVSIRLTKFIGFCVGSCIRLEIGPFQTRDLRLYKSVTRTMGRRKHGPHLPRLPTCKSPGNQHACHHTSPPSFINSKGEITSDNSLIIYILNLFTFLLLFAGVIGFGLQPLHGYLTNV
jgi:hypothetical protein